MCSSDLDYLSLTSSDEEKINSKLSWVAFKQQFFSCIFIAKNGFEKPTNLVSHKNENSKYIKNLSAHFELPYLHKTNEQLNFSFYFGPNNFKELKRHNAGFEELIPLGWGIFGDRKSTRLNSSHKPISYAVFCLNKKNHRSCTM